MAFTLIQAGTNLYTVNSQGGLSAALTLPTGITLSSTRVPRFTRFNRMAVLVNTPSRPITVDSEGVVRVLTPNAPNTNLTLSGVASGTLSGTFRALQTFIITDSSGNLLAESDYGPTQVNATTITTDFLKVDNLALSIDAVSARRLYRTATLGTEYFKWVDADGNLSTSITNDASDADLSLFSAPELGAAPDLTLVAEWNGRLWGVDRDDIDNLRYTESGKMYAWAALNSIPIQHVGADSAGITALIPRRNALGVARRDTFMQVTGTTRSNLTPVGVAGGEGRGVVSQESVVVENDIAYFLWRDGVYKWDSTGIKCVSDGKVRSWFTTDTYFNRSLFHRAYAQIVGRRYRLFLTAAGSTSLKRWVELDLDTGAWWGPHLTTAFVPSCAVGVAGANGQPYPMVGSLEGYLLQEQEAANDRSAMGIPVAFTTQHDFDTPDAVKYWGQLSVFGKTQAAGTMTITPTVGDDDDAVAQDPIDHDLTQGRERLCRLGTGISAELLWEHETIDEDIEIHGYTIDPVTIVGRR